MTTAARVSTGHVPPAIFTDNGAAATGQLLRKDGRITEVKSKVGGTAIGNLLTGVGGAGELPLKIVETGCGWTAYTTGMLGGDPTDATNLGKTFNKGAKFFGFGGAISALGNALNSGARVVTAIDKGLSGDPNAAYDGTMAGVDTVGHLAKGVAQAGEFTEALFKEGVVEVGTSMLGATIQGAKIIKDAVDLTTSTIAAADTVKRHEKLEARKAKGEIIPANEQEIHDLKGHESWLGMVKNIAALALHILSFIGIVLGCVFAQPILLSIGTVVLITSIALFFIGDNRKAKEQEETLLQINQRLAEI